MIQELSIINLGIDTMTSFALGFGLHYFLMKMKHGKIRIFNIGEASLASQRRSEPHLGEASLVSQRRSEPHLTQVITWLEGISGKSEVTIRREASLLVDELSESRFSETKRDSVRLKAG
jgi:hypothetical protein